jgi:UDP-glucose 4-epimerase
MDHLRNKNVLVTGATGFIGRHLVNRLLHERANVWALLRQPVNSLPAEVHQVIGVLEHLDASVWHSNGVPAFDTIYHLGAYTPKANSAANDLQRNYSANIVGTRQLLHTLNALPACIVLASTLDVYAPVEDGTKLSELSPVDPASLYGSSKLFTEAYIAHWANQMGVSAVILRYGHIFGPGEEAYKKLIPETIRRLLNGVSPVVYGDGSATRDLLYVDDAIEATIRAACLPVTDVGPVNIVRGESVSIRKVVEVLARFVGFHGEITYRTELPAGRHLYFDNSRMTSLLGQWSFVPLEIGLQQEVDTMRSFHDD